MPTFLRLLNPSISSKKKLFCGERKICGVTRKKLTQKNNLYKKKIQKESSWWIMKFL